MKLWRYLLMPFQLVALVILLPIWWLVARHASRKGQK